MPNRLIALLAFALPLSAAFAFTPAVLTNNSGAPLEIRPAAPPRGNSSQSNERIPARMEPTSWWDLSKSISNTEALGTRCKRPPNASVASETEIPFSIPDPL